MARGGALNLVGAVIAAAAIFGVTVLVTREYSRAVAGAFFTATSAFLVVEGISALGSNVGLVYFIARLRSLGEERRIPAIFRAAVVPVIIASMMGAALLLLFAMPMARVLLSGRTGGGGAGPAAVADSLRALAVALPFAALMDTFLGATRGYRDMRPTVMVDRIGRSVGQLTGVVIAAVAGSAAFLAPLWVLPYVPAAAIAWLWLRRVRRAAPGRRPSLPEVPPELAVLLSLSTPVPLSGGLGRPGAEKSRMARRQLANANPRGFWRFTAPRALANFASIILQRLDIMLVAIMRGPADAAVYTAATRFLVAGQFGNMAISMAAQPRFTELFTIGDRRNAKVIYQVTTAWLVLLTWPLYLLAIVYGPELLTIFGRSYRAGDVVMVILGFATLVSTACGQVDMVLITTGRSTWSLANGLIVMVLNIGLDIFLIPRYGIAGAAIGWAIAIVVDNLVPLAQLAAMVRMHPFGRATFVAISLSTVSFCLIPLVIRAALGQSVAALAAGIGAGCAVETAGLWLLRDVLQLSAMPGFSFLKARWSRR